MKGFNECFQCRDLIEGLTEGILRLTLTFALILVLAIALSSAFALTSQIALTINKNEKPIHFEQNGLVSSSQQIANSNTQQQTACNS